VTFPGTITSCCAARCFASAYGQFVAYDFGSGNVLANASAAVSCGRVVSGVGQGGTITGGPSTHPFMAFTEINCTLCSVSDDAAGIYSGGSNPTGYGGAQTAVAGLSWRLTFAEFTNCTGSSAILDESSNASDIPVLSYCVFCTNKINDEDNTAVVRANRGSEGLVLQHCLFWRNSKADLSVWHVNSGVQVNVAKGTILARNCVFSSQQTATNSVTYDVGNSYAAVTAKPTGVFLRTGYCYVTPLESGIFYATAHLGQTRSLGATLPQNSLDFKQTGAKRISDAWASSDELFLSAIFQKSSPIAQTLDNRPSTICPRSAGFIEAASGVLHASNACLRSGIADHTQPFMDSAMFQSPFTVSVAFQPTSTFTASVAFQPTSKFTASVAFQPTAPFTASVAFQPVSPFVAVSFANDAQGGSSAESGSSNMASIGAGLGGLVVVAIALVALLLLRRSRKEKPQLEPEDTTNDTSYVDKDEMQTCDYENPIVESAGSEVSDRPAAE
jgi:hypothetical protein